MPEGKNEREKISFFCFLFSFFLITIFFYFPSAAHHNPKLLIISFFFCLQKKYTVGRKRRAIRFPDDNGGSIGGSSLSSSSSGASSSFVGSLGSSPSHSLQLHHHGSGSSSSPVEARTTFFDDESYDEFQSIGLGQQELDMLRQLPENLQYEYRQEMQELETSASEPREADIMEYLTATNEFDTDHCIAKGICEVMARGNVTSNRFEHLLLDYYK